LTTFEDKEREAIQRMAGTALPELSEALVHHCHLADRFLSMFTKEELEKIRREAISTLPIAIKEVEVGYKEGDITLSLPQHHDKSKRLALLIHKAKGDSAETLICYYEFTVASKM